jgi:tetratricopeptide (TPR) repeat protein
VPNESKSADSAQGASSQERGEAAPEELFATAVAHDRQGSRPEAEHLYRAVLEAQPSHPGALHRLGAACMQSGRREEAVELLRRARTAEPASPVVHNDLGIALASMQQADEARAAYEQAIALAPDYAEAHNNLGMLCAALGRFAEAVACYHRAIAARPDFAGARNNLGNALVTLWRFDEAIAQFLKAIAAAPNFAEAHSNLATALAALDLYEGAAAHYRQAVTIKPDFAAAHINLGHTLVALNRPEEAIAACRRAIELTPQSGDGYFALGHALRMLGRLAEVRQALERGLDLSPARTDLHRALADVKQFAPGDPQLAAMEKLAGEKASLRAPQRIELHFALAKAYADIDEPEQAFAQLIEGNGLKRHEVIYNEAVTREGFQRVEAAFTPELLRQKRGMGDPSAVPIFVFGMPRSGTTLVEQIIASHPKVFGADERMDFSRAVGRLIAPSGMPIFPDMIHSVTAAQLRALGAAYLAGMRAAAPAAERITDKWPANFVFAGLIHLALPNAKLIHVSRDPPDTCLSCFARLFAGPHLSYTYDLGELGRYYRGYEKLMAHWRRVLPQGVMLDVQYEELIADFEPHARRIVAHCGLEWDESCLSFHATQRPVRSASAAQVRQPLYRSAVGRWRRYAAMLGPLLEALGSEDVGRTTENGETRA